MGWPKPLLLSKKQTYEKPEPQNRIYYYPSCYKHWQLLQNAVGGNHTYR
jgi:hypothetical protein